MEDNIWLNRVNTKIGRANTLPISFLSIFYYPGAGGSISTTTKPIHYVTNNSGSYAPYQLVTDRCSYPLYGNFVTSVSGGGGGSYAWKTDYDASVDSYNMGNTWGAPRRSLVGGMYDKSTNNGTRSMHCEAHPYAVSSDRTIRGCRIGVLS